MKIGDLLKVKIIDEDNIGNGIAKIDNFVIFIKNALKDEELEVKINSVKTHYATASINKIIKESKYRIPVKCKYYDYCGGCNFLHTSYLHEKEIKKSYLERLFNTKIDYLDIKLEENYRNKVVLHSMNHKLGLYNDKTHDICEIDHCLLLNSKINEFLPNIKEYNLSSINEIMIRCIKDKIMINVKSIKNRQDIKDINCDSLYINSKYIKGEKYLIDEINNYKFSIYPNSFYQVNREGMLNIYNKALEYISSDNKLLDLYCGTGTIGIWMNNKFNRIVGLELNKEAIRNANINKKLNNIDNIEFICDDASNIKGYFDSIIVDPPRSGLSSEVINYLNDSKTKQIIYISCNPNTLKRDINLLNNYKLIHISCTDMFPRTKHIECVCLLERR